MKFNKIGLVCLLVFALGACQQHGGSSSSTGTSTSSEPVDVIATAIDLNKTQTSIRKGSNETLTVTFTPENTTNKDVNWATSNATIASVANGVVTANKAGTATITATSVSNPQLSATCQVTVADNVVLSGVDEKHEFTVYNTNKTNSEANDNGFYDHAQTYKVGDDNPFNVKPVLRVVDDVTFQPVSASDWDYDFVISATTDGQPAGSQYFSVVDARDCDVQFTEAAVGKTFTISVAPGGVSETRAASLTKSITVDVIDGYNVYDAKELGYFDTRAANDTIDNHIMEGDVTWQCKWTEFKTANGMKNNYTPAALILQEDITVTTNDLPANFFYTAAEAAALNDTKAAGSLRDWMYIYERTTAGDITIDGNYFSLDFSNIPLIKRERFKTTDVGAVVGHASIFKVIAGGDILVRNVNMTGNAKNATDDADKIYGGGVMFVKGSGAETFKAYNTIATKFFITFMGESPYIVGNPFTKFDLDKVKCFNNYNSFMYNWGSTITAKDSLFRSCGGPVIIQDHTGTDTYENATGSEVYGNPPTTNFIDCTIKNYVTGFEAWFQQFNATTMVGLIKSASDLLYATGFTKSFVINDKGEGKVYAMMDQQSSYFNFIVLNKSGESEGITTVPACGTVNIIEADKTTEFDYNQPAFDLVFQGYAKLQAAQAAGDADAAQAAQMEIAAALMAKGYTIAADGSNFSEVLSMYLTTKGISHGVLRQVNSAGSAVFDFGDATLGTDLLAYDGQNNFLQSTMTLAGGVVEKYTPTADQLAALPNYVTLYYGGMALVFGAYNYVL